MMINFFWVSCIFIVLVVLFVSEKNIIDLFAEQYNTITISKDEFFLNFFMFILISYFFIFTYHNIYRIFHS
ncbi:hypothetical protein [Candidatus Phytoplasma pini]|uniref:Uncharacterized protein n=1 Tax=Candidatus Phytoplasma pini TaxID=267362 RepID=A0A559KJ88_9MOLU|nr:hypothetical protein [Candidatus Phytoplasma pini]TVY12179.1 hypothetical protein MDPP_00301 [Candidatus Phytoplasma pini]